jgi:hypothetical protein
MAVDDSLARVRDSVARTLTERGALIRYQPRVMTLDLLNWSAGCTSAATESRC